LPSVKGEPIETLHAALGSFPREGIIVQSVSRFYTTPCFPKGAGPDYVNAAVLAHSDLTAIDLLSRLHKIESELGREREERWGQRTLDLDLLTFGDEISPDLATFQHWQDMQIEQQTIATPDRLILPHPRIQDRAFVLVPLVEIAPDWRHPVFNRTARQLLDDLDTSDVDQIVPV